MDEWDFADEVDVLAKLPENFDEMRESKKWLERKEVIDNLANLLETSIRLSTKSHYGEIVDKLQTMLAKDANINVQAGVAKCFTGLAKGLRGEFKQYTVKVFPVAVDKLKEKKPLLREPLIECIDAITSCIPCIEVLKDDVVVALGKPNPQIKQQSALFVSRQINRITSDKAPKALIKAVCPLLAKLSGDADADVREASMQALGSVQRLIGEKGVRSMVGDLASDEGKLKKISEMAEKAATEFAEHQSKNAPKNVAAKSSGDGGGSESSAASSAREAGPSAPVKEADPWDFLEAFDVVAKMPADFDTNIESKKWLERKTALQSLHELITANPKLDPKANYGELIGTLKRVLEKDANINVCAMAAKCIAAIALGLRKKFCAHSGALIPVILEKLKEKKPLLRDPLVESIDAVANSTTLEAIGEDIIVAMEKANPNIKIQTDLFLYRSFKFRSFKKLNAQTMPKKTFKAIVPLLVKHTGESDPEVRDASYAALGSAMRTIGEKPMMSMLSDIADDKNKMTKIKEFFDKASEEVGPEVVPQMVQSVHKADPPAAPAKKKETPKVEVEDVEEEKEEEDESLKPPAGAPVKKEKKEAAKKEEEAKDSAAAEKKAAEELLTSNDEKLQRIKQEKQLKILKWNFASPTEEHVQQLQDLLGAQAKASLAHMLFHKDFKQHLKAVETLTKMAETQPDALVSNSDLLYKWCTLRFFETNPAVLIKVLELVLLIVGLQRESGADMSTEEVLALVPHLLIKTGEQKENMRSMVRAIIEEVTAVCGPLKMCPLLIDALKTKNSRQRAECLQVLETYVERAGLTQLKQLGLHKAMAACLPDRDVNVRNAAINGLVACYREEGDQMWRNVGKIADKERAYVEERIKRTGAAPGSTSGKPPRMGGPKIKVPQQGKSVSRPSSATRRDNSPDAENAMRETNGNSTFSVESRGRSGGIAPSTSRYAIDEDFVEMTGIHSIKSTALMAEIGDVRAPAKGAGSQSYVPSTPTALRRTNSSSSISSIDSMDQLEKVIHNISSGLSEVACEALQQVFYMTSIEEQRGLLDDRIDMLLKSIAMQMRLVRTMHRIETAKGLDIFQTIFNLLQRMFPVGSDTLSLLDEDTTYELLWETVHMLHMASSDPSCKKVPGIENFARIINRIILKMCSQCEMSVFLCASLRCLSRAVVENAIGGPAKLFAKCVFKWADEVPKPLRLGPILTTASDFYDTITPLRQQRSDDIFTEYINVIETSIERVVIVMGTPVLDALRRVPKPNPQLTSFINVIISTCKTQQAQQGEVWPLLPGQVPPDDLPQRNRNVENLASTRDPIHILVDNVVRDVAQFEKHISKLAKHLEAHPEDVRKYDEYTKEIPLGTTVRLMVQKHYDAQKMNTSLPPTTDPVLVDAIQRFSVLARKLRPFSAQNGDGGSPGQRNVNIESFSGELPVPTTVERRAPEVKKKRRTMDQAALGALQSRLAGISHT